MMLRILIVADQEVVRRGLKDIFSDEFGNVEFGESSNSRAALEAITRRDWDLVLFDLDIRGRGGLELLQDIKQLRRGTPILTLSVCPEGQLAVRALQLGAAGYLNKGAISSDFVTAARRVLAGRKYITQATAERMAAALARDPSRAPHETLSNRELDILLRIADGRTLSQIAEELKLSVKTVGTYRARISRKTGLKTKAQLVRYVVENELPC